MKKQEDWRGQPLQTPEDARTEPPKKKGGAFINVLLVVSILGLLAALGGLLHRHLVYKEAAGEYEALQEAYLPPAAESTPEAGRTVDLAALRALNPDVMAWVEIPGTKLSYPVVQGADNDYYLNHTVEGTYNPSGAVFMDYSAPGFNQANTLLYGHNMKDGSMFHTLESYLGKTGPDYHKLYNTLYLYTDEGKVAYEILWVKQTDIEDPAYRQGFAGAEDEAAYIEAMGGEGAGLAPTDKLLTLSTCVNNNDNETPLRIIMQAVRRGVVTD